MAQPLKEEAKRKSRWEMTVGCKSEIPADRALRPLMSQLETIMDLAKNLPRFDDHVELVMQINSDKTIRVALYDCAWADAEVAYTQAASKGKQYESAEAAMANGVPVRQCIHPCGKPIFIFEATIVQRCLFIWPEQEIVRSACLFHPRMKCAPEAPAKK